MYNVGAATYNWVSMTKQCTQEQRMGAGMTGMQGCADLRGQ
jgi:hypothetical protein